VSNFNIKRIEWINFRDSNTPFTGMDMDDVSNETPVRAANNNNNTNETINLINSGSKFHPNISLSFTKYKSRIPSILVFGSVCKSWRHASLLHPMWRYLAWHHLLPLSQQSNNLMNPLPLKFMNVFAKEPSRLRSVHTLLMDLRSHGEFTLSSPNLLIQLLNAVNPIKLTTIVVDER
jgi:hypothetical protein